MDDYIRDSNQKKNGLYLDTILDSEYDPFIANQACLKYKVSDKNDPLKLELNYDPDSLERTSAKKTGEL